jgi:hypothetical protein
LKSQYPGIFDASESKQSVITEVNNYLGMSFPRTHQGRQEARDPINTRRDRHASAIQTAGPQFGVEFHWQQMLVTSFSAFDPKRPLLNPTERDRTVTVAEDYRFAIARVMARVGPV